MYHEIPPEKIGFVLVFINTQTFQNKKMVFKKPSILKNASFPLTNILICFYSFFMIYHIIWIEDNKKILYMYYYCIFYSNFQNVPWKGHSALKG